MNESKLKKAVEIGSFGLCPRCGKLLMMFQAQYKLYGLTESGRYPNKLLKSDERLTAVCTCGFRTEMIRTVEGTVPIKYYKNELYKKQLFEKPKDTIGYNEDN